MLQIDASPVQNFWIRHWLIKYFHTVSVHAVCHGSHTQSDWLAGCATGSVVGQSKIWSPELSVTSTATGALSIVTQFCYGEKSDESVFTKWYSCDLNCDRMIVQFCVCVRSCLSTSLLITVLEQFGLTVPTESIPSSRCLYWQLSTSSMPSHSESLQQSSSRHF